MNTVLGLFFMLLPFIFLFGAIIKIEGFKFAVEAFGISFGVIGFVLGCAVLSRYFLIGA